jgi:non-specific serine/threonine protein kinase
LLEGQTLAQRIGRQPIELGLMLTLGIQIADALESAHAKGIVHRDIKPANIFVNGRGQAKVLDFGLAKIEGARRSSPGAASQVETMAGREDLTVPGTAVGTVAYMSPEQARGLPTDARTDLYSLGAVLYQMATGAVPFEGDTSAVIYEAILNRTPTPPTRLNGALPPDLDRILDKALDKERNLRYQSATDLKTDLIRLKRAIESGGKRAAEAGDSRGGAAMRAAEKSIAVLYFENLSGVKEDEYLRDGITEDIITELSKIKGLNIYSRATLLGYRDKPAVPVQIGQQLGAAFVLCGSLRRAGNRLRINAQLVDTRTDFQLWSERYDREMADVFEVQDEIARKIAEALRVTLSPQEQAALAAKPTDNLQAYDLFLRGKSYARRLTRQDLEFALQMFESAVAMDPTFALAYAALAKVCAEYHFNFQRDATWIGAPWRPRSAPWRSSPTCPSAIANAWVLYAGNQYDDAIRTAYQAIGRKRDCEGAYYLLGRAMFSAGRFQDVVSMAEDAIEASGEDYNVYGPIMNALGALGKDEAKRNLAQRRIVALEKHLKPVPEDARARVLLAVDYVAI